MLDSQRTRKRADALRESFERYKWTLPLLAETYAAMLEKVSDDPEPYRAYLERPGREPIIRLTEVMRVDEPWQRALDHLQTLLVAPAGGQEPQKKKGKRLIWLLDPDIGTIEPVEQTAKRDGWNAGRALSFRRVVKNDPPLEMDDDDRRVVNSLYHGYERSSYSYNVNEVFGADPNKTLLAMVGHPRVFDANDRTRQLELVRYPVELVISEARGGYRIALSHFADAPSVFLEPETRDRYRVIEVPADVVKVGALLGPEGMIVPRDGRERVVGLVRQAIGGSLPIRSEIDAVDVPAIEGSPTPVLRLVPVERGLRRSRLDDVGRNLDHPVAVARLRLQEDGGRIREMRQRDPVAAARFGNDQFDRIADQFQLPGAVVGVEDPGVPDHGEQRLVGIGTEDLGYVVGIQASLVAMVQGVDHPPIVVVHLQRRIVLDDPAERQCPAGVPAVPLGRLLDRLDRADIRVQQPDQALALLLLRFLGSGGGDQQRLQMVQRPLPRLVHPHHFRQADDRLTAGTLQIGPVRFRVVGHLFEHRGIGFRQQGQGVPEPLEAVAQHDRALLVRWLSSRNSARSSSASANGVLCRVLLMPSRMRAASRSLPLVMAIMAMIARVPT